MSHTTTIAFPFTRDDAVELLRHLDDEGYDVVIFDSLCEHLEIVGAVYEDLEHGLIASCQNIQMENNRPSEKAVRFVLDAADEIRSRMS